MQVNSPELGLISLSVKPEEPAVYDPFRIPPNIEICKKHRQANLITANLMESQLEKWDDYCPCCGLPVNTEKIGLCANKMELSHVGVSFPLYFQFIKYSVFWILIFFCITGAYDIATNSIGAYCKVSSDPHPSVCQKNFITDLTLANKQGQKTYLRIHQWLNLAAVVVLIIMFQFYRKAANRMIEECDKNQETPSDFTIEVQDLPADTTADEVAKFFMDSRWFNGVTVEKVVLSYSIGDLVAAQHNYNKLKKKQMVNKSKNVDDATVNSQVDAALKKIEDLDKQYDNLKNRPFTGIAFVTFTSPSQCYRVLYTLKAGFIKRCFMRFIACCCSCCGCFNLPLFRDRWVVDVKRAPEPSDVNWENLDSTDTGKLCRRSITNFFTLVLLAVSFGLSILVTYYKSENPGKQWLAILASIIIVVINNLLGIFIRKFAAYEKHSTVTRYNTSVAEKLTAAMFINTGLVVLLTNSVDIGDFLNGTDNKFDFWGRGLMSSVTTLLLMNAFTTNLLNLFSPWNAMAACKRRSLANSTNSKLTQEEANKVFEGSRVDIAQRYANSMKTLIVSFFFAPAVPIVLVFSFFGEFLTYYIDFYLITRVHSRPPQLGKELAIAIADDIEWVPVAFAAGNLIFNRYAYDGAGLYNDWLVGLDIIILAVTGAVLLLPMDTITSKILKCCCKGGEETNESNNETYEENRQFFADDYDLSNPVTRDDARKSLMVYLKVKNPLKYEQLRSSYGEENKTGMAGIQSYLSQSNVLGKKGKGAGSPLKKPKSEKKDKYLVEQNNQQAQQQPGVQQQDPNPIPNRPINQDPTIYTTQRQEGLYPQLGGGMTNQQPQGMINLQMQELNMNMQMQQAQQMQAQFQGGMQPQFQGGVQFQGGMQPQFQGGMQPQFQGGMNFQGGMQPQFQGGMQQQPQFQNQNPYQQGYGGY